MDIDRVKTMLSLQGGSSSCPPPEAAMPLRTSCPNGPLHGLPIGQRGRIRAPPSTMPPWVPLVAFAPKRQRFWRRSAGGTLPKGPITRSPGSAWSRGPVTSRAVSYASRARRAPVTRWVGRSWQAWHRPAWWPIFGALAPNAWWPWTALMPFRPQACLATTGAPGHAPRASPSPILPPSPPCSSARHGHRAWRAPWSTSGHKTDMPHSTVHAPRANAG